MSLMNEVRQAIAVSHNAIEQTGFSIAMLDGTLPTRNYACGLVQLLHIHQALEECITNLRALSCFFTPEMVRTEALMRDLAALGYNATSFPPMEETTAIVHTLQSWAVDASFALLGSLYILEGSRMGSLVIAKPLARTLRLQPGQTAGIEYHVQDSAQSPMRVRQLKERIDSLIIDAKSQEELKFGAVRFMEMLNQLYARLPAKAAEGFAAMAKCPFSHTSVQSQLKSA